MTLQSIPVGAVQGVVGAESLAFAAASAALYSLFAVANGTGCAALLALDDLASHAKSGNDVRVVQSHIPFRLSHWAAVTHSN